MSAFHKVDLLDFWRGRISPRKLMVWIKHLPRESAFVQAVSVEARWSTTDYLLAHVIDIETRSKPSDPRFPRPAEMEKQRKDAADRADRLERQSARVNAQLAAKETP